MGAHNAATLEVGRQRVQHVIDHFRDRPGDDNAAFFWAEELTEALKSPPRGTLKSWMQAHHDEPIDTLQMTIDVVTEDGKRADIRIRPQGTWIAGSRRVDASRATKVLLDGSSRLYGGVVTLAADDLRYIGFASWGEGAVQLLAYVR